jgi:hypothetical protein
LLLRYTLHALCFCCCFFFSCRGLVMFSCRGSSSLLLFFCVVICYCTCHSSIDLQATVRCNAMRNVFTLPRLFLEFSSWFYAPNTATNWRASVCRNASSISASVSLFVLFL